MKHDRDSWTGVQDIARDMGLDPSAFPDKAALLAAMADKADAELDPDLREALGGVAGGLEAISRELADGEPGP